MTDTLDNQSVTTLCISALWADVQEGDIVAQRDFWGKFYLLHCYGTNEAGDILIHEQGIFKIFAHPQDVYKVLWMWEW